MATENTSQQQLNGEVSQDLINLVYSTLRYFFTEDITLEATGLITHDFLKALPKSGYKDYSKLLALRLVHNHLKNSVGICLTKKTSPLGKEDALILLLRDHFYFSCKEIGAVTGIAEGSIRTRLERSRASIFSSEPIKKDTPLLTLMKKNLHACILVRQKIEDHDPSGENLNHEVTQCQKCHSVLQSRLASLDYFQKQNQFINPPLIEKLKMIPTNSIFMKKKGRLKLNWAHMPWFFKVFIEGLGATLLTIGVLLLIPKVKQVYEFWVERRLDVYNIAELNSTQDEMVRTQEVAQDTTASLIKPETEFSERDSERPSRDKTYRVLIKSDDPTIAKTLILDILKSNDYSPVGDHKDTEKELAGGVIFDILVPAKNYKSIVKDLSRLGETKIIITHSKDHGFKDRAHLLIWLQSI